MNARRAVSSRRAAPAPSASRVLRCKDFRWTGVQRERYKAGGEGDAWARVSRHVLIAGSRGAPTAFDVRYFEIAPGGCSSLEEHRHSHVVIGIRGRGRIRLGRRWHAVERFDVCYVGPHTAHELRNESTTAFGFLCVVDARRDRLRASIGATLGRVARATRKKGDPLAGHLSRHDTRRR